MSDDETILNRLENVLDSQSLSLSDDVSSTAQMIQRISHHIADLSELENSSINTPSEYDNDYENDQFRKIGPRVELPDRPTPYEVWKAKNEVETPYEAWKAKINRNGKHRTRQKLQEDEWDDLVHHLHNSNKMKQNLIMQQDHRNIADELVKLSFKPVVNPNSKSLAADVKKLVDRQDGLLKQRKENLAKQVENQMKREMEKCSFQPELKSREASEKILAKSKGKKLTPQEKVKELLTFSHERTIRNLQRKQIMEEIEDRELTFKPQLNRTSLQLQERLVNNDRIKVDSKSKQTLRVQHNIMERRKKEARKQLEQKATPIISEKAKKYKPKGCADVHERLYEMGKQQIIMQQNICVLRAKTECDIPLRVWETERKIDKPGEWCKDKKQLNDFSKNLKKGYNDGVNIRKSLIDKNPANVSNIDEEKKPINIVEYKAKYEHLLGKLNASNLKQRIE